MTLYVTACTHITTASISILIIILAVAANLVVPGSEALHPHDAHSYAHQFLCEYS